MNLPADVDRANAAWLTEQVHHYLSRALPPDDDTIDRDYVLDVVRDALASWRRSTPEPILPPVWDAEAKGWRCPYSHDGVDGLMAEPTRRLVAIETVDDWREILDVDDPDIDHEHGPVMLVGDSSYGDGSLDSVSCRHCQRDVDISGIDLDYV